MKFGIVLIFCLILLSMWWGLFSFSDEITLFVSITGLQKSTPYSKLREVPLLDVVSLEKNINGIVFTEVQVREICSDQNGPKFYVGMVR